MIPIYLTTYKRPEYLKRSLDSIHASDISQGELKIFEDKEGIGTRAVFKNIMTDFLANSDADCFVLVQDDLEYHKEWLNKLLDVKQKIPKLGILTACDMFWKGESNGSWVYRNIPINVMVNGLGGGVSGQNWLVTRKFVEAILKNPNMAEDIANRWENRFIKGTFKKGILYDKVYVEICLRLGFNIAATIPSYVNHFGVDSSLAKRKKLFRTPNYIG